MGEDLSMSRANMKKQLLLAALMLVALGSNAQTEKGRLTIQPRVGMTLASFTGGGSGGALSRFGILRTNSGSTTGKVGFTGGADIEYGLSDEWSVSAGVGYSQLGANDYGKPSMAGTLTDGEKEYWIATAGKNNLKYSLDYLTVPITAAFHPYKGLSLLAGVQLGLCLGAHAEGSYYVDTGGALQPNTEQTLPSWLTVNRRGESIDQDFDEYVHKIDLGIPVGIAYEYRNFVVDARYVFGLLNLSKWDFDGHLRNSAFSLTLGYKFVIK